MTPRQLREIEYHKTHAEKLRTRLPSASCDVLYSSNRRWWNHYWSMYDILISKNWRNKAALVVGCGSGEDAIRLARLGARVYAFDLSDEMIRLAKDRTALASVDVDYRIMSAEQLSYGDNTFDLILVRDILHHCEVIRAFAELIRVSKDGSFIIVNELYTHSILQACRETRLLSWLQARLAPVIYGGQEPYITPDERKLNETELCSLEQPLTELQTAFFGMFVGRLLPEHWKVAAQVDRLLLRILGSLGYIFAGRFIVAGSVRKTARPPPSVLLNL